MFHTSTVGRSAIVATTFALLLGTAACGNRTGEVDQAVPAAPAAVLPAPHIGSADQLERRGAQEDSTSEWGQERRGYQFEEESDTQEKPTVAPPGKRIPDFTV